MMANSRLWVLGAPDPEMHLVEALLTAAGCRFVYAGAQDGARVHPGNAYKAAADRLPPLKSSKLALVECGFTDPLPNDLDVVVIDHHRPGDPGFGQGPARFFEASSVGQVLTELGVALVYSRREDACRVLSPNEGGPDLDLNWSGLGPDPDFGDWVEGLVDWPSGKSGQWAYPSPPAWVLGFDEQVAVYTAAADHCLGSAYQGLCPCVDPEGLGAWRATERAVFQHRPVSAVMADIEQTTQALRAAPILFAELADMRRKPAWPELPEAGTRAGLGYVAGPFTGPDNRKKFTCSGSPEQVTAFQAWARGEGLVNPYGDPARGFAGAYIPE